METVGFQGVKRREMSSPGHMEKIFITSEKAGQRIDKFLAKEFFLYSRGEVMRHIKKGEVMVNGKTVKPSYVLEENDEVTYEQFPETGQKPLANNQIPLDIIFQNKDIVVINKQAGLQVHESHNEKKNTLVNALLAHFPEITAVHDDSEGAEMRPGIVHRLDKDTSGVMVVARNIEAFNELKSLFKERGAAKTYVALAEGMFKQKQGIIDKPIARAASYRKQTVARGNTKTKIRTAITEYDVLAEYGDYSLVELYPKTGRTHQLRVHLSSLGHPIVGDALYGAKGKQKPEAKRQLLHAKSLDFELLGQKYAFSAPKPADFDEFVASLKLTWSKESK